MLEAKKNIEVLNRSEVEIVKKNTLNDFFIHFFCFLSILLIGADKWGINVGINFRLDQIILIFLFGFLCLKGVYRLSLNYNIILFAIFSAISTILAFNVLRGVLFYFSIIYNIIFIFYSIESYVKYYGIEKIIKIFRLTMYVQFIILIIQLLLKVVLKYELPFLPAYGEYFGIPRFNLWFYEPSYLSTYLLFWLMLSAYNFIIRNDKSFLKDLIFCLIMIVITTSSTGFIGIVLVFVITYLMWIKKGFTVKKIIFPLVVVGLALIFSLVFSSLVEVFIGRLFEGNLDAASGGRISLWTETFNVFIERPIFGVGPGNYGLYLGLDVGSVPSNVTLELMATLGITSTLAFYGLTFSLIRKSFKANKRLKNNDSHMLVSLAMSLIIFTIILQANQGYLRLYHWMFFGIISGGLKYCSRQEKTFF